MAIWRRFGDTAGNCLPGRELVYSLELEKVYLGFQYRKCCHEFFRGYTLVTVANFCFRFSLCCGHGSSSNRGLRPSSVCGTSWHPHTFPPKLCCYVLAARNFRVPQLGFGSGQLLLANHVRLVSAIFVDAAHWVLVGLTMGDEGVCRL